MIHDPTVDELLDAVSGAVGDADASFGDFHRRVARNAIGIVRRELAARPRMEAEAVSRMAALLGETGAFGVLEARLIAAIRNGAIAQDDPALRDHLKRFALDMLAIDQPRYTHELTL